MTKRKTSTVVISICKALCDIDAIGVAVEPLATMSDPYNDIEGDYTVRACFWVSRPEDSDPTKLYCIIFEAFIIMDSFKSMPDERFKRNLRDFATEANKFRAEAATGTMERRYLDSKGVKDLGSLKHGALKAAASKNTWPGLKD